MGRGTGQRAGAQVRGQEYRERAGLQGGGQRDTWEGRVPLSVQGHKSTARWVGSAPQGQKRRVVVGAQEAAFLPGRLLAFLVLFELMPTYEAMHTNSNNENVMLLQNVTDSHSAPASTRQR